MKKISVVVSISIVALVALLYSCNNNGDYKEFNKGRVYYTQNISEENVADLGNLLVKSDVFDGSGGIYKLDYKDSIYYLSAVTAKENISDIRYIRFSNLMRMLIKGKLFPDNEVVYQLCDKNFKVLKSIASEEDVMVDEEK